MKYWTELNTGRPGRSALMLRTDDGQTMYCALGTPPEFIGPSMALLWRDRAMHHAVHILWSGARKSCPAAFEKAVELGWIKPPNDCSTCRGRGCTVENVVDEFRQALKWGCVSGVTGEGLPTPMMAAKVECPTCGGRGWF